MPSPIRFTLLSKRGDSLILASLVAFLLGYIPAHAESTTNPCHRITGASERLNCYDSQTGFSTQKIPSEADESATAPEPDGQQWQYQDEVSQLDDRKDVWLSLKSLNTQPNQIGHPETARLWVRCMNNSTNVFITFNDYTSEDQNVRYRLDDAPVKKVWMQTMNGGDGIGLWSGKSAIPLTKRFFGKDKLVVAYDSYSNHNLEFTFDISGLRSRIEPLASSCNWLP